MAVSSVALCAAVVDTSFLLADLTAHDNVVVSAGALQIAAIDDFLDGFYRAPWATTASGTGELQLEKPDAALFSSSDTCLHDQGWADAEVFAGAARDWSLRVGPYQADVGVAPAVALREATLPDGAVVDVPAWATDVTSVLLLTTGAHNATGGKTADYTISFTYDFGAGSVTEIATVTMGTGAASGDVAVADVVSAGATLQTGSPCQQVGLLAVEVPAPRAGNSAYVLTSVTVEYPTVTSAAFLAGPLALSIVTPEAVVQDNFLSSGYAADILEATDSAGNPAVGYWYQADWTAVLEDVSAAPLGAISLSVTCADTVAELNLALLPDLVVDLDAAGTSALDPVCLGTYLKYELDFVAEADTSPELEALSFLHTLDEDGDGALADAIGFEAADCDDGDPTVAPGLAEVTGDGIDQNCDGVERCWFDDDNDGDRATTDVASADADCADAREALTSDPIDCDDTNASVSSTDAEVVADVGNLDEDCDGGIACFVDADLDGVGGTTSQDGLTASLGCDRTGYSVRSDDCDDGDALVFPGGVEVGGDDVDDDCDGRLSCFEDQDGDLFGTAVLIEPPAAVTTCAVVADVGWSDVATDCDDGDAAIFPGAAEIAGDGIDQDCTANEQCYADVDKDGERDAAVTLPSVGGTCLAADGLAFGTAIVDCDDTRADINHGAVDVPGDDEDEDCSGTLSCFVDGDLDGVGGGAVAAFAVASCAPGAAPFPGYSDRSDDCDDADAATIPGAVEVVADASDNDCSGSASCYEDLDGDSFGSGVVVQDAVKGPTGYCDGNGAVRNAEDCNDENPTVKPATPGDAPVEIVGNAEDEDCDCVLLCYVDGDGDSFGTSAEVVVPAAGCAAIPGSPTVDGTCVQPDASANAADCDDADAATYPAAPDTVGDGIPNDCDNGGKELCYVDTDLDGDRDPGTATVLSSTACTSPGEALATALVDCKADDPLVNSGASEVIGDADDNDCNGALLCYVDADADLFGAGILELPWSEDGCGPALVAPGDCDDANPLVNPAVIEGIAVGGDSNCDGLEDCWVDDDGDGFGGDVVGQVIVTTNGCEVVGYSTVTGDCDDTTITVAPDLDETCEGSGDTQIDNDCNGDVNSSGFAPYLMEPVPLGATVYYEDDDGDGFGDPATATLRCQPEPGWSSNPLDCNDGVDTIFSGADEICDGIDQNCNALFDEADALAAEGSGCYDLYIDLDADGHGDPTTTKCLCVAEQTPEGSLTAEYSGDSYVSTSADCDDTHAELRPHPCNDDLDNDGDGRFDANDTDCVWYVERWCFDGLDDDGDGLVDNLDDDCPARIEADCALVGGLPVDTDGDGVEYQRADGMDPDCLFERFCDDNEDNDQDGLLDDLDPDCWARPGAEDGDDVPGGDVSYAYVTETLDGHDNDCDGYIPLVELDCDDDGSIVVPADARPGVDPAAPLLRSEDLGLAACAAGESAVVDCWGESMTVTCDAFTGLLGLAYDVSEDGFAGRLAGGYRVKPATDCAPFGDCDDTCGSRCPGVAEQCDGVDNDCSLVPTDGTTSADPGAWSGASAVPAASSDGGVPGYTSSAEIDRDLDSFTACDDEFDGDAPQNQPAAGVCGAVIDPATGTDCEDLCYLQNEEGVEFCNGFVEECGATSAEGSDGDADEFRTCGAFGAMSGLAEEVYVPVWTSCVAGPDGTCEDGTGPWEVVPLLLPRAGALTGCDGVLYERLFELLRDAGVDTNQDDPKDLGRICAPEVPGTCAIVRITLSDAGDELAESALEGGWTTQACLDAPEQYATRTVWTHERILQARETVREAECQRLFGDACDQLVGDEELLETAPVNVDDYFELPEFRGAWWIEIGRYLPVSAEGAVMTCWGDPREIVEPMAATTGGDCDDSRAEVHRDQAEGPQDVVATYAGSEIDCSACIDGLDNNCDGNVDCADPSCDVCFVGQGTGCSCGGDSTCSASACAVAPGAERFAPAGMLAALLTLARRRRGRS